MIFLIITKYSGDQGERKKGYVARVVEKRIAYRVLVGKLKESDHLEILGIDGGLILSRF
jgi:hypothetical protein